MTLDDLRKKIEGHSAWSMRDADDRSYKASVDSGEETEEGWACRYGDVWLRQQDIHDFQELNFGEFGHETVIREHEGADVKPTVADFINDAFSCTYINLPTALEKCEVVWVVRKQSFQVTG